MKEKTPIQPQIEHRTYSNRQLRATPVVSFEEWQRYSKRLISMDKVFNEQWTVRWRNEKNELCESPMYCTLDKGQHKAVERRFREDFPHIKEFEVLYH